MAKQKATLIMHLATAVLAVALGGALLAACGGAGAASTAGHPSLTLYNGQHVQTTQALVAVFEKETGITVEVRNDTEATLADQILVEGAHSPADVLYTENSPPLENLQAHHLLAGVPASTQAHTQARFDSPAGKWVGVSARVSVLVYNTRLVKITQVPRSVMDLADRRWKGRLALAPTETDFQPVITAVDRAHGAAATVRWLDGLKANASGHVYPDNETVTDEVNNGQAAIGIVDQYYWYRLRAQRGRSALHSAIAHFAPGNPGYVVDVSGAGVLRSSRHKAAADRFVAFLTSRRAQEIIAHGDSFEYPIDSGVTERPQETPLAELRPDPLSIARLGTGATAVHLLQQAQLL